MFHKQFHLLAGFFLLINLIQADSEKIRYNSIRLSRHTGCCSRSRR